MKFPKSLHAEGWADHIDTSKSDKSVASSPLHAAKAPPTGLRMDTTPRVAPSLSSTVPPGATPRVDPLASSAQPRAAALPPQRENRLSWMIGAGAGAAVLAALGIWAMNRPADTAETSDTPPAVVIGSTESSTVVAAATPPTQDTLPAPQADRDAPAEPAAAPAPTPTQTAPLTPAKPAKPAAESRPVAQAPVAAARPDMVVRAAPGSTTSTPPVTPYLQPRTTIADAQPTAMPPGAAPIVMPPTSAGAIAATTPQVPPAAAAQVLTPPVVATAPDPAATSTAVATSPLAQAQVPPAPQPVAEDSGITVKVRMALAADSTLAAVPIAVSTAQGVVKLEGQAPDAPTRERATVVAASALGVKAVDNRLTLPPATVVGQLSAAQ